MIQTACFCPLESAGPPQVYQRVATYLPTEYRPAGATFVAHQRAAVWTVTDPLFVTCRTKQAGISVRTSRGDPAVAPKVS